MPVVLVDTNLLVLLVVGLSRPTYIAAHGRLQYYDVSDFEIVRRMVEGYDDIVTTPHILAEVSSLIRKINNPARDHVRKTFRKLIDDCDEIIIASSTCREEHFLALGLTDAVSLRICSESMQEDVAIELLTADEPLYNRALSLGLPAELYK